MIELLIEAIKNLSPAYVIIFLALVVIFIIQLFGYFKFRTIRKNMKKRVEELESQKCDGPHKWFYMPVDGETVNVCELCCWSPTHEGYIKRYFVDAEIKQKKFNSELEKHVEFRLKELDISKELYEKVINIKKDFAIEYIEKQIKEMVGE